MQIPNYPENVKYAGFGIRAFATIIDMLSTLILVPIFYLFDYLFGIDKIRLELKQVLSQAQANPTSVSIEEIMSLILQLSPSIIFQTLFVGVIIIFAWRYFCATPGKMLLGLKIVDKETGHNPSYKQSTIRFFGSIVSCLFCGLGFIWVHYHKKHQGWHDLIAKTVVIYYRKDKIL